MKSNLEYWQDIYSSSEVPTFPSQFAVFTQSWLGSERCNIFEVGCGNGRDAIFLSNAGHNVVVTDQCINSELQRIVRSNPMMNYVESDVVDAIENITSYLEKGLRTIIYSRFFQHAIDDLAEQSMLKALGDQLPANSELFFEFRLKEDQDQFKVFGTDHYRRFQTNEQFLERLSDAGFVCNYQCKGQGFARYGKEDPVVGRFVASPATKVANPAHNLELRVA